jgi:hypothetical protein
MRKAFVLGLVSMAALAFGAGNAAASPIYVSPGGAITATGVSFTVAGPLGVDVVCDLTLSGSLNKTMNSIAGTVASVDLSGCNYRTAFLSALLPMTMGSVSHTVPLTSVLTTINNIGFEVFGLPLGGDCLFSGSFKLVFAVALGTGSTNSITTLRSTLNSTCPLLTGTIAANQPFALSPTQTFII